MNFSLVSIVACSSGRSSKEVQNGIHLTVLEGFEIDIFAEVENVRAMCLGEKGTIFAGSRGAGKVFAILDSDGDHKADEVIEIDQNLNMPVGVAFKDGDLYVSAVHEILKYEEIENRLKSPPEPIVVYNDFPKNELHGWKFIDFGPDDNLYVSVGAPCNICKKDNDIFATIMKLDLVTGELEHFCKGVRNSVGFDWHPITKELWFTDNGRDWMGDDKPPCELNRAHKQGLHFGYPFCHSYISDPKFGKGVNCDDFEMPALNFEAHVAPLGMCFYTGDMFPPEYKNQIFVALHGSWNRSTKIGYEVVKITVEDNTNVVSSESFVSGFENSGEVYGRPVDVLELKDASLLISDDYAGLIYRVTYQKP